VSKIISLFAWLAVEEVRHPAAEVARFLGISRMGVHKAVTRGFELQRNHESLG
jgi:DNA-binding CsgD family transcriptional regulator